MKLRTLLFFSLCCLPFASPPPVHAWGFKGHEMAARVAVRHLPADMPEFFLQAQVELGYLCNEPDFWRSWEREPALTALHTFDHFLNLEYLDGPLPPNRYEFLLQYTGKAKPYGGTFGYRDLGFAPYAMAEYSEMLTENFLRWRQLEESSPRQQQIRRQVEKNILHIAGLLAHFVTDTAQPLHTTIHTSGWRPEDPNPKGYAGEGIHRRYETDYVNQAIGEADFQHLVGGARVLGPWLEEALQHIREAHRYVEQIYALDRLSPFGEGNEPAEAKELTCRRLASAAEALRNFWYSAWIKSGELAGP